MISLDPSLPIVSVIIPAYNSAAFLDVALCSVAEQSFRDFEVIVVDDHSTDGTKEMAVNLLQKLGLVGSVFARPKDFRKGAGGARNAGAAAARGRILAFLDSDDAWVPAHLGRAVAALGHGDSGIVAYCAEARASNPITGESHSIPFGGYSRIGECDMRQALLSGMIIPNVTLCVDAGAFHQAGGYAEDLACYEDWWLVLHLAGLGKFFVDPTIGCNVLIRENSLSNTKNSRGTHAMSTAMFRDALKFVRTNRKRGWLTKNEMRQLQEHVACFIATQLFSCLRARMLAESLAILGSIASEATRQPRLMLRILARTFSLSCGLVSSKLLRAR